MSRWEKPGTSRMRYYSRMLVIGSLITLGSGITEFAIFIFAHETLALTNAIGELTLAIMLLWASVFIRKMGDYGSFS